MATGVLTTLPPRLKSITDEILDLDTHEMMPAQVWVREMGEIAESIAVHWLNNRASPDRANHPNVPGYEQDIVPIDAESIWRLKGPTAPGATDPTRRPAVMDLMGVKRQLMFPTGVGMYGAVLAHLPDDHKYAAEIPNRRAYGHELIEAHNDWVIKVTNDRVRAVAILFEDTVDELMATAQRMVGNGVRAVWMLAGELPAGKSPAHPDLDPLWSYLAENNIAVTMHAMIEENIYSSNEWNNVPVFEGFKVYDEFKLDPWSRSSMHILASNFLTTMVLGGVFDRHPTLRFGSIEIGAYWIGPLCDTLDYWYDQDPGGVRFSAKKVYALPEKPSFYIKRNVRVTPFYGEKVDEYIRRYDLEDVLCFASDYPHVEGGKDPIDSWFNALLPLGDDVVRKFFVGNGKWLLPG